MNKSKHPLCLCLRASPLLRNLQLMGLRLKMIRLSHTLTRLLRWRFRQYFWRPPNVDLLYHDKVQNPFQQRNLILQLYHHRHQVNLENQMQVIQTDLQHLYLLPVFPLHYLKQINFPGH